MLFLAGVAAAAQDAAPIASFESDADNPFRAGGGAVAQRVEQNATHGRFSLRVLCKGSPADTWPGITLPAAPGDDWSARETLEMDIFLEGDKGVQLSTRVDAEGCDPVFGGSPLKPGWNRGWALNLKALRNQTELRRARGALLYVRIPREDVVFYVDNVRWGSFRGRFKRIEYVETRPRPEPSPAEQERGFVVWGHSPLETVFQVSRPAGRLERLRLFLSRGELEPAAFSVYALRDLRDVGVAVTDLRGPGGAVIPAAKAEVKAMRYLDKRVTYSADQYYRAFPAYLAAAQGPIPLAADRSQTFQVVLEGPAEAPPGRYSGVVSVSAGGQRQEIPLDVLLLPWRLPEAEGLLYGEYYRLMGRTGQVRDRIRADLADMRRQGMTSVGLCFGVSPSSYTRTGETFSFDFKGDTPFDIFMETCAELGFREPIILLSDSGQGAAAELGPMGTPAHDRAYTNFHTALAAAVKARGWPELIVQPVDEPGWQDQASRDRNVHYLKLLKAAGIRTEQDGPGDAYFHREAGPHADVWNYNGALASAEMTARALAEGRLVTFYNNDVESYRPEVDRWAYGLFNWRWRMHGGYNWEYRGGSGDLYDNLDAAHGDWVHYYLPQGDEPGGPSTGWEGSREGVDDRRYLLLTERLIARAGQKGGLAAERAAEARADLEDLRQRLDDSPRVRGRAAFAETLTPEQAAQRGLTAGAPGAAGYATGAYKHPNGLSFAEYDAIRWLAAWHAWRMLEALGEAPPPPARTLPAGGTPAERLSGLVRERAGSGDDLPRPAMRIPRLQSPPRIDGDVDGDAGWAGAAEASLALSDGSGPAAAATAARIGLHGETLYVAFLCAEPDTERMVASVRTPDGEVWKDDCVEVFLDPGPTGKTFYQVIVNSLGTVARVGPGGKAWKPPVEAAARVEPEKQRWLVELAIPAAGMGLAPRFGLNFARERRPMEVLELSTWSPTGGPFGQPERFGLAVLAGDLPEAGAVTPKLGLAVSPGYALADAESVVLELQVRLPAGQYARAAAELTVEGPSGTIPVRVPAPLAERVRATLAAGDLAPGTYTVTARLVGTDAAVAPATARFTRVPLPW